MNNILDALITDRTEEDAAYALALDKKGWARMTPEEQAEYRAGLKGGYCYIDLNRVTGAMEYLDGLMQVAGVESGYTPLEIPHTGSGGKKWTDTTWIDYDKPRPHQWAAYLENVAQFWRYVAHIDMEVLPAYDPHGLHYIKPWEMFSAGDICTVTKSNGLLRLVVDIQCDPGAVTASGIGWGVAQTSTGLRASYRYPGWMFADITDALNALVFGCSQEDGIFDASLTFRAELRPGDVWVTSGPCAVRWSSMATWGALPILWPTWGDMDGLTWYQAERGEV